jgi:outer membrane immunogenic protein
MKRFLLRTAAALAMTGSAMAADLPAKAPPVTRAPPVQVYNWTGCYVAGGGGYGMFNQDVTNDEEGSKATIGGRGWFGTVGGGCDLQIGERWVFGAFGDYDFSDLRGDFLLPGTALTGREKQDSAWAAGGRLGYTLTPNILAYVNAGYSQARFSAINLSEPGLSIGAHTYSGWFVGSGYEYRLDWFPGLFWRTEYRYAQYGKDSLAILADGEPTTSTINSEKAVQTIRSELVWRFNWGGRY